MMTDVMVPALGESVSEATVSTWFKKPGDAVKQDEMLCELETDKVSVEVPSPVTGVLAEIIAPEGTTVAANARLAIVTEGAAATGQDPDRRRSPSIRRPPTPRSRPPPPSARPGPGHEEVRPAHRRRRRALGEEGDGRGRAYPPIRSRAPAAMAGDEGRRGQGRRRTRRPAAAPCPRRRSPAPRSPPTMPRARNGSR